MNQSFTGEVIKVIIHISYKSGEHVRISTVTVKSMLKMYTQELIEKGWCYNRIYLNNQTKIIKERKRKLRTWVRWKPR